METIKNYLETMFSQLQNTPEVSRAKEELGQMMEDKYAELIAEGKSENEAVGIVIAEFGNLDELAEDLGIKTEQVTIESRRVTRDEAMSYLQDNKKRAMGIAAGVFLCINSVVGPILAEAFRWNEAIGVTAMFVMIAAAVALFIFSGTAAGKWSFFSKEPCSLDFNTISELKQYKEANVVKNTMVRTAGIMLCILSILPAAVLDGIGSNNTYDNLSGAALFVIVSIGVFLIINASMREAAIGRLLKLDGKTILKDNVKSEKDILLDESYYPWARFVLSVYWSVITCIYLCWSFITFDWHISWIIWPAAAIIRPLFVLLGRKGE